ncbi:MAG: hypothetical protein NTV04_09580 [Deltaproteobacteria bacterium]|nr:hypothetical protein [Deltaproteobacteria bacterium]
MTAGKKVMLVIIFLLLAYGISAPFQKVSEAIYWGIFPAPIFYLLIVHVLFVAFIGYMVFGTRMHGRAEDEESFLAEIRREKGVEK